MGSIFDRPSYDEIDTLDEEKEITESIKDLPEKEDFNHRIKGNITEKEEDNKDINKKEDVNNNEGDSKSRKEKAIDPYLNMTSEEIIEGLGDTYYVFDLCESIEKLNIPSYEGYNIILTHRNIEYGTLIKRSLYISIFTSDLYALTLEEFDNMPEEDKNCYLILANVSAFKSFNDFLRKIINKEFTEDEIRKETENQKEISPNSMKKVTYDECKEFLYKTRKLI